VYGVDPLTRHPGVPGLPPELGPIVQFIAPFQEGTLDPFFAPTALLVCFALIGQVFELRTREQSASALLKLAPLAPKAARIVLSNGSEEDRAANLVKPGELVRVRAGERIPVDGVIREGVTTIDESMLTGEATRAERGPGGRVLAGSENGLRPITVEATRVGSDTLIDQVIGLIAQAQTRRAAFQRAMDRLIAWYLPVILLVAVATFATWLILGEGDSAFTYAAVCAVAVFVVACPCAVGLATSAATVIGMRRAAEAGILFRDAASLERLVAVDMVLLDKTGTLTEGKPKLAGIVTNSGVSEAAVLAMAAAVERGSEHPLALAIVWEAFRRGLEIAPAEGVEAIVGKGIRGLVGGQRVSVGRLGFLQESGVYTELMLSEAQAQRHRGHVVVFVGEGKRCVGLVVMNDPLRVGTRAALDQLRSAGMRLVLLTGDHAETANGLARNIAISEVVADALPVEKFAVVQKFKGEGRVVAMCGDGVNDAPALVAADVGIALGSGTGAAIGTAGVTLVQSDLRALGTARELSRAVVRTIRQNLILAFAFNVLAIPIAAGALIPLGGGLINSVWATAAMSIGSLVVLVNSLRLALRPINVPSQDPTPATGDNASKK
jgi:P-type Cu+ transporter